MTGWNLESEFQQIQIPMQRDRNRSAKGFLDVDSHLLLHWPEPASGQVGRVREKARESWRGPGSMIPENSLRRLSAFDSTCRMPRRFNYRR